MSLPVPILLYHFIAKQVDSRVAQWAVSPERFASHMQFLKEGGYTPLTVTQFTKMMSQEKQLHSIRPVVITFDDGLADFYTEAMPVLTRHGFCTTLYITTGYIGATSRWLAPLGEGRRPMLTWSQIAEIQASQIECGAHTHWHHQLDTLPLREARMEIVRSQQLLKKRLGRPVHTFAYPHGYFSPAIRTLVHEAGFSSACGVKHAMSTTKDDRFALSRIVVTEETTVRKLRSLLKGHGLRHAPSGESLQTRLWRMLRRSTRMLGLSEPLQLV
jgi:peptidoglycan/xylan/chitin deacetylase (PgdA/CDA1 family)